MNTADFFILYQESEAVYDLLSELQQNPHIANVFFADHTVRIGVDNTVCEVSFCDHSVNGEFVYHQNNIANGRK